jgi:hypothetical protein
MPRRAVLTALAAVTLVSVAGIADAADRNVPPYGRGPGPNKPVIVGATGVGVAASNWAFYGGEDNAVGLRLAVLTEGQRA